MVALTATAVAFVHRKGGYSGLQQIRTVELQIAKLRNNSNSTHPTEEEQLCGCILYSKNALYPLSVTNINSVVAIRNLFSWRTINRNHICRRIILVQMNRRKIQPITRTG